MHIGAIPPRQALVSLLQADVLARHGDDTGALVAVVALGVETEERQPIRPDYSSLREPRKATTDFSIG